MSHDASIESRNLILKTMAPSDRERLAPHLEQVKLAREDYLTRSDEPIEYVYFLESGVASVTSLSLDGERTEIGVLGYEGVSGISRALGSDRAMHETFMQIGDASAFRIDAGKYVAALEDSTDLRQLVLRFVHVMMVQMTQSAHSYARLQIEGRLARWLLLCRDRTDTDELNMTHEFMAAMIGSRRSGVTLALHVLEGAGMIRAERGKVTLLKREKLLELAGECYGLAEAEYRRLIAPFGTPGE